MKPKAHMTKRALAEKIARALFTDGANRRADTLRLQTDVGRSLGGWCEAAVADVIEDHLRIARASLPAKATKQ